MDLIKLSTIFILSLGSLFFQSFSSTLNKTGFTLELIPRDSIHSPLYPGNLTDVERVQRLVNFSKSHAHWIKSLIIGQRDGLTTIRPALIHFAGFYLVKVQVGPASVYLMVDTGSSPIWTQTESCNPCFPQVEPKYNPNASPNYKPLLVGHPLCDEPRNGQCIIDVRYNDGTFANGIYAEDNFIFDSSTGNSETIPGVVFGCINKASTTMFDTKLLGGIIGMGRHKESLISQLAAITNENRFSHCMVAFAWEKSYLKFGSDIVMRPNAQGTPFVINEGPLAEYYYVSLTDISINGNPLNLPPDTFEIRKNGDGGVIIDSGTPLINLVRPAYDAVKGSFMDYFSRYPNLVTTDGSFEGLDLCYLQPNFHVDYPSMDLHFRGANVHVPSQFLFNNYNDNGINKFCLFIVPAEGGTIIGAQQIQNQQVVYDLQERMIYFAEGDCQDAQLINKIIV